MGKSGHSPSKGLTKQPVRRKKSLMGGCFSVVGATSLTAERRLQSPLRKDQAFESCLPTLWIIVGAHVFTVMGYD